jgi:GT2 family glycosyltransferase
MRAETVLWLLQTLSRLGPQAAWLPIIAPKPVEHNRNVLVSEFLKTDCTHLFHLDSDNVPHPGTIEKLLSHNLPFVAAPSEAWKPNDAGEVEHGVLILDYIREEDGYRQHHPFQPGSGLQKCDAVGGAGMMIRRDVLERMQSPWFRMVYDDNGFLVKGEDFEFCDRLRQDGYELYADCDIIQRHIKGQ